MIRGRVENGVVVLKKPGALREGTEVAIQPIAPNGKKKTTATKHPTVRSALAKLAGKAKGLPRDAARNLDHYLYGHEKR
jgi:hypothetical protein